MLMEQIHVWVGTAVHKSILRFYMYCFCPCHQVACWVQFGLPVIFSKKAVKSLLIHRDRQLFHNMYKRRDDPLNSGLTEAVPLNPRASHYKLQEFVDSF